MKGEIVASTVGSVTPSTNGHRCRKAKRTDRNRALLAPGVAAVALGMCGLKAFAGTSSWNGSAGDGNWSTAGNWSFNTIPGSNVGTTSLDSAIFNANVASNIITVDPSRDVGTLLFDGAATAYTIGSAGVNGGNALHLSSGGNGVQLGVSATSFTGSGIAESINAPLILEPASSATAGAISFINNSTTATDSINIQGSVSADTTSAAVTLTLAGANTSGNNVISGVISDGLASGDVALVKSGAGEWTLAASNTFSGGLTLSAGTLNANNANALGTGPLTISSNATSGFLDNTSGTPETIANTIPTLASVYLNYAGATGGSLNLSSGITSSASVPLNIAVNGGNLALSGALNGYSFNKSGSGSLTISGSDTTPGSKPFTLSGGTLNLNSATAIGQANVRSDLVISAGTYLDNTSGTAIALVSGGGGTVSTWNGDFTFVGSNSLALGSGGGSVINLGTTSGTRTVTVMANTLTVPGIVNGTATGLSKAGNGTLSINANSTSPSTYTGGTSISAGMLLVNNTSGSGTGTGAVSVTGGTLGGTGTISGAVSLTSTGSVQPGLGGTSIGKLSISSGSNFTLSTGTTYDVILAKTASPSEGVSNDTILLTAGGAFTVGGSNLQVITTGFTSSGAVNTTYRIVDATASTGSVNSTSPFANLAGGTSYSSGGLAYTVTYGSNYIDLNLTSETVPEPASLAILSLGGMALMRRRRSRNSTPTRRYPAQLVLRTMSDDVAMS